MTVLWKSLFVFALLLLSTAQAQEKPLRDYSDIARFEGDLFLVVHDFKSGRDPGPRMDIVGLTEDRSGESSFSPVIVDDWKDRDGVPSDFEAICSIPGRSGEFLVGESGYWKGKYGRTFHIKVSERGSKGTSGKKEYSAEVLKVFRFDQHCLKDLSEEEAKSFSTPRCENVEGIACLRETNGDLILLRAFSGSKAELGKKPKPAVLHWGKLDLDSGEFDQSEELVLTPNNYYGDRGVSAMCIVETPFENEWTLYAVATVDPGDYGPFKSLVYQRDLVAKKKASGQGFTLSVRKQASSEDAIRGLVVEHKVEGVSFLPAVGLVFGSDDEALQSSVWHTKHFDGFGG